HSPALDQCFQPTRHPEQTSGAIDRWVQVEEKLNGRLTETAIPNLHVLTTGILTSNSRDLLHFRWDAQLFEHFKKAPFDYVIFDTPPLLPVADAQLLTSYVEAMVLIVDAAKTPRKVLLRVKHMLNRMRIRKLGVVINKSDWAENHEMRWYFDDIEQQRTGGTQPFNRPGTAISLTIPPETPLMSNPEPASNNLQDKDITLTLPSQPQLAPRDEQSRF
ncbi:MAG: hypothetical protein M3Z24_03700, partial [Chloroflexota bacterium]|nr:hypothetical protein [Chloroflexota bacterium]